MEKISHIKAIQKNILEIMIPSLDISKKYPSAIYHCKSDFNSVLSNSNNSSTEESDYLIGDYLIKNTIGKGNFGKVKLGILLTNNLKVAVKILKKNKIKQKNDQIRVKREFEMLAKFNHINVILVAEIFESEDCYYTVMQYCEKGELFDYIVKKKYLSEEESAFFYYQLINGLEYIHSLGIVHRDLKPENLLLTKEYILKIIDFGLSNYYNINKKELLSTPCGSPCYASPEMVLGKKYNGCMIDIWASGIILYAMLCGYLPFEDKEHQKLFKKISECKVDYPEYISKEAKSLLNKILVNDPEKRITIEEIKKHPFYIKGKEIFEAEFNLNNSKYSYVSLGSKQEKELKLTISDIDISNMDKSIENKKQNLNGLNVDLLSLSNEKMYDTYNKHSKSFSSIENKEKETKPKKSKNNNKQKMTMKTRNNRTNENKKTNNSKNKIVTSLKKELKREKYKYKNIFEIKLIKNKNKRRNIKSNNLSKYSKIKKDFKKHKNKMYSNINKITNSKMNTISSYISRKKNNFLSLNIPTIEGITSFEKIKKYLETDYNKIMTNINNINNMNNTKEKKAKNKRYNIFTKKLTDDKKLTSYKNSRNKLIGDINKKTTPVKDIIKRQEKQNSKNNTNNNTNTNTLINTKINKTIAVSNNRKIIKQKEINIFTNNIKKKKVVINIKGHKKKISIVNNNKNDKKEFKNYLKISPKVDIKESIKRRNNLPIKRDSYNIRLDNNINNNTIMKIKTDNNARIIKNAFKFINNNLYTEYLKDIFPNFYVSRNINKTLPNNSFFKQSNNSSFKNINFNTIKKYHNSKTSFNLKSAINSQNISKINQKKKNTVTIKSAVINLNMVNSNLIISPLRKRKSSINPFNMQIKAKNNMNNTNTFPISKKLSKKKQEKNIKPKLFTNLRLSNNTFRNVHKKELMNNLQNCAKTEVFENPFNKKRKNKIEEVLNKLKQTFIKDKRHIKFSSMRLENINNNRLLVSNPILSKKVTDSTYIRKKSISPNSKKNNRINQRINKVDLNLKHIISLQKKNKIIFSKKNKY